MAGNRKASEFKQSDVERLQRAVRRTGVPARLELPNGVVIVIGKAKSDTEPDETPPTPEIVF